MDLIFLIGRIVVGLAFIIFGLDHFRKTEMLTQYAKMHKIPSAKSAVILGGLMLIFGGLGLMLWFFSGIASVVLIIFLLTISFSMHHFWNIKEPQQRAAERINFLKNMTFVGFLLIILSQRL